LHIACPAVLAFIVAAAFVLGSAAASSGSRFAGQNTSRARSGDGTVEAAAPSTTMEGARPSESSHVGSRARGAGEMLMTTTSVVEGKPVSRYLGIVTGEAIIGANVFRDIFASVRDIVGGRSATYERGLAEARQVAMTEVEQRATELGANAVIAIDIDYEVLGQNNGMLMVSVSGTAVIC
jgi:uncharacterized protein YbjQ (UPF0145 family)